MFTLNIEKHMAQRSCSHEVITCFNAQGSQLRSFWIEPHSTHSSLLFYKLTGAKCREWMGCWGLLG